MNAVRSEALRAVSGLTFLAVLAMSLIVPVMVLTSDAGLGDLATMGSPRASFRVIQPLAWAFVGSAFLGAYTVTRETYYGSLRRTVTSLGLTRAYLGKAAAGAIVAVGVTAVLILIWVGIVAVIFTITGIGFSFTGPVLHVVAGALVGAFLGGVGGAALGWIIRNYYLTAAVVLVIPVAVELPLWESNPDLLRFSPGLVLAAISVPGLRGDLLETGPALALAVAGTGALTAVSFALTRRRAL